MEWLLQDREILGTGVGLVSDDFSELSLLYIELTISFLIGRKCGKGYQPKAEADNPYLDLDYSGYHKNLIQ